MVTSISPVAVRGGGNPGNISTTSSGDSSDTERFTADDLLKLSNEGDTGRIIQLISQTASEESGETTTIVMSAADLGLPADGTVTLIITGVVSFAGTAGADADGNVTFVVPKGETGKTVTVELVVTSAGGRVICSGSETQKIIGDTYNIHIRLTGEAAFKPRPVISSNGTAVAGAAHSFIAVSNTDLAATTLSLEISNASGMQPGSTLVWTVNGVTIDGTPEGTSSIDLAALGCSAVPCSVTVSCTALCPDNDDLPGDPVTVSILPRIPPFEVTLDICIPPATAVAEASGPVNVHYLSATQLPTATDPLGSGLFTFSASPVAVPMGTTADDFVASGYSYDWTVDGVSLGATFNDGTVDLHLPNLGITDIASMPTVRTNYTIGCRISRADSDESVEETYTLTLEPKLHTVSFMSNSSTVAAFLPVLDGSSIWDGTTADGKCVWDDSKASPPVIRHPGTPAFFDGWYTDDSLTTPFSLGAAITADADAYARWQDVDEEKRNPSPPDIIDEDGSDHSYLFDMKDFTYSAGTWSSAIKIKNSVTGSTTTVYMDIRGTNKSIGYNHGGIKFFGSESGGSTDGGTINVIFSTSTTGTLELGFLYGGTNGNIECVSNVTGNISVDPNCTVSEMKVGSTTYTDWDAFIAAARANTSASANASFRITRD